MILTVTEAAEFLKVQPATVRRLARDELVAEIQRLGGKGLVVSTNVALRRAR